MIEIKQITVKMIEHDKTICHFSRVLSALSGPLSVITRQADTGYQLGGMSGGKSERVLLIMSDAISGSERAVALRERRPGTGFSRHWSESCLVIACTCCGLKKLNGPHILPV